jgi:hypothetical protein
MTSFTGFTSPTMGSSACAKNGQGWYCWGYNGYGQLGLGTTARNRLKAFEHGAQRPADASNRAAALWITF